MYSLLIAVIACVIVVATQQEATAGDGGLLDIIENVATQQDPADESKTRIVGGALEKIELAPWHLSMQYKGNYRCGAVIVNKNFAVSAAHCTEYIPVADITLRSGSDYRTKGKLTKVTDVIIHESYDPRTFDSDICVLRVETPFVYSAKVDQINLPLIGKLIPDGAYATVTGYGAQKEDGISDDRLRAVDVPVVSQVNCNAIYDNMITWNMVCAGYTDGGKDSCQGDSGGPLVRSGHLIGIVSWGYGCARPNYPGVYVRIASPSITSFIVKNSQINKII